jgi:hypothetical protein
MTHRKLIFRSILCRDNAALLHDYPPGRTKVRRFSKIAFRRIRDNASTEYGF